MEEGEASSVPPKGQICLERELGIVRATVTALPGSPGLRQACADPFYTCKHCGSEARIWTVGCQVPGCADWRTLGAVLGGIQVREGQWGAS